MRPKCAMVLKLVDRAVRNITHLYVTKRVQTVLTTLVRMLMSVKERRINPLLVVVLTNVVQKHKHKLTLLTNPLLHLTNHKQVKLMFNLQLSILLM